jgi:hypothetical protein
MLTTFQPCAIKEAFRKTLSETVMRLSATTCTLANVAGKPFLKLKRECKVLKADILVLKKKIAVHRNQHGC